MMTEFLAPAIGSPIPLLFTYGDTLFGNGFIVEVKAVHGRALCVHEADGYYWMYGVNPGGMAAHGDQPESAHQAFRTTFSNILKNLADESASFEDFRRLVAEFFNETNTGLEPDWLKAVDDVRRNNAAVAAREQGFPVEPAESPRGISVERKPVGNVKPQDNVANTQLAQAA